MAGAASPTLMRAGDQDRLHRVALPLILIGGLEVFGVWAFGGWGDPENLAGRIAWVAALGAVLLDLALLIMALVMRAPAA